MTQLEQKFDSLESEQLPALKKDRIEISFNNNIRKSKIRFVALFVDNSYHHPMLKMVRNAIRQSKENYLSIDDLERVIYGQGSTTSQYSSSSSDMMNTLMVSFWLFIALHFDFQMLMIQQQLQEMTEKISRQQQFGHLPNQKLFEIPDNLL